MFTDWKEDVHIYLFHYFHGIEYLTVKLPKEISLKIKLFVFRIKNCYPDRIAKILLIEDLHTNKCINPLKPRRTQVFPFTKISILF